MPIRHRLACAAAVLALAATAACTTDPATGERRLSRAGIGAAGGAAAGALLGTIVGGRHSRTEAIVGAGIGAIAGTAAGGYMDRQEAKLRAQTAGTGVSVRREGDDLYLQMPAGITFATNEYQLRPEVLPTLDRVAATLAEYRSTFVDVYGHTDSTGSDAVNQPLSENRARAVADYLAGHGVEPARIAIRGLGATMPIASNDTPEGRQANRRVEIKLVPVTAEG